jgi:catechol 2,3-dioxygenase-like lactoylglutathione lyase family enzyme
MLQRKELLMNIAGFDHFVLTVASIDASCGFYERVLGMKVKRFGEGRVALVFGSHKINLHETGREFKPNAAHAVAGSGDFCLLVEDVAAAKAHVEACGVEVFEGPVARTGARGPITSIYLRDMDGNLIELARYD